jgi:hypothetical protein
VKNEALIQTFAMILNFTSNQEFGKEKLPNFSTMSDNISAIKAALRVLMAITDRVEPPPTDVAELHRIAPECADLPLDELACELVRRALEKRGRASGNEKMNGYLLRQVTVRQSFSAQRIYSLRH